MRDFKFDIPEDNPFQNDVLDRKNIAVNLTNIIDSQQDGMVLAIDSRWGTGKTTFIRMWRTLLANDNVYKEKFSTLYYNAWENDYIKEPLISVLSELNEQIIEKEESIEIKSKLEEVMDGLKPLVKSSGKVLLNILTKGALEEYGVDGLLKDGLQQLSDNLGKLAFEEVGKEKNIRKELKERLKSFQDVADKKIIVFIDELDRCRPTYAIELLETIKHIFDLDNYIFVISLDKQQLGKSVKTIYGSEADTVGYLRRFFDIDYKLPLIQKESYLEIKSREIEEKEEHTENIIMFLRYFIINSNLSLRDIDKLFYFTKLLLQSGFKKVNERLCKMPKYDVMCFLYAFFICLKFNDEEKFNEFLNGNYDSTTVEKICKKDIISYKDENASKYDEFIDKEIINNYYLPILKKYLIFEINNKNNITSYDSYEVNQTRDSYIEGYTNIIRSCNIAYICKKEEISIKNDLEFVNSFNLEKDKE